MSIRVRLGMRLLRPWLIAQRDAQLPIAKQTDDPVSRERAFGMYWALKLLAWGCPVNVGSAPADRTRASRSDEDDAR
ncbi:MAG: hypothetical protein JHD16_00465 [Solirubrobacteraceae bacterium]|nr:hypothetical protein [Solirubrobacteraceae bacterium]